MENYKHWEPWEWALAIVGVAVAYFGAMAYIDKEDSIFEMERAKAQPKKIIIQDLNRNNIPEKFYDINGKKFFLEIDGKNLEDVLRE